MVLNHQTKESGRFLLTIAVPTYNRATHLRRLLNILHVELHGLQDRIAIVVSDNASTDSTENVTAEFKAIHPNATIIRQERNLGADENFCRCLEQAKSPYLWIIGDDDVPKSRLMQQLIFLLENTAPDLVYLQAEGRLHIDNDESELPVGVLKTAQLSSLEFARTIHVNTTFISTIIVNLEQFLLLHGPNAVRKYSGSSLVHLGWILPLIRTGKSFVYVRQTCVLATQKNSGGYSIFEVIGQGFTNIVNDTFGTKSSTAQAMLGRCALQHLPDMIWNGRFGSLGQFDGQDPSSAMAPALRGMLSYWIILLPILHLPRLASSLTLKLTHQISTLIKVRNRLMMWRAERRQ